jgi:hypothetical protein
VYLFWKILSYQPFFRKKFLPWLPVIVIIKRIESV